jgi:hypothetical protein
LGLTAGALDIWKKSKHWECTSCIENQAQDAVKHPEVSPVSSQERVGGVRCGLQVLQLNLDGIGTAIPDVISLVREDPGLDVLLLQETKLIPANPTPTLPGYSAIRLDQPPGGGRGGGRLLTYVKADIPFHQIPAYREEVDMGGLEALAIEIQRGARGKFVVINQGRFVYQLPSISLGATSMHISPSGMTPNPEMGGEPSWRSGLMDNDLNFLNDDCGTRINCVTTGESAPDITLVHNSLVTGTTWKQLPIRGSDHFPLLCEVDVTFSHLAELDSKLKWNWCNAD